MICIIKRLKLEHELFKRYVDDETESLAAVDPGVRFVGGKLVKLKELVA